MSCRVQDVNERSNLTTVGRKTAACRLPYFFKKYPQDIRISIHSTFIRHSKRRLLATIISKTLAENTTCTIPRDAIFATTHYCLFFSGARD
jgi:hypothetical protein